jgi:D-lactate dehydrogenase
MGVVAHDIREDREFAERLGFEYESLEDVLRQADVLTVHVPASSQTENLIADQAFAQMKDGVVLLNTARGCVVNIKALVRALGEGKVAAVGLDVLPEEPTIREEAELLRSMFQKEHDLETLLANHVLLRLRNVYITPHSAFNTREAVERILDTTVENIQAFERGQPQNLALAPNSPEAPGS